MQSTLSNIGKMLDLSIPLLKDYLKVGICNTNLATIYNVGVPDISTITSLFTVNE